MAGLLYTIPSLALFVVLPGHLGTRILDPLNVVVALTLYTVALLVRVVADALDSVPPLVVQSASAMGYRPLRSLITVQLPLAVPVIGAGCGWPRSPTSAWSRWPRCSGSRSSGQLFTIGFQLDFYTPIIAGIVLCLLLAAVFDIAIQLAVRLSTPWTTGGEGPMTGAFELADHRRELDRERAASGLGCWNTSGTRCWRWPSPWSSHCRSGP